jgi:hypothetical protein
MLLRVQLSLQRLRALLELTDGLLQFLILCIQTSLFLRILSCLCEFLLGLVKFFELLVALSLRVLLGRISCFELILELCNLLLETSFFSLGFCAPTLLLKKLLLINALLLCELCLTLEKQLLALCTQLTQFLVSVAHHVISFLQFLCLCIMTHSKPFIFLSRLV